jgi:hypothetical protein
MAATANPRPPYRIRGASDLRLPTVAATRHAALQAAGLSGGSAGEVLGRIGI